MSAFAGLMLAGMVFGAAPDVVWELTPYIGFTEKAHGLVLCPDSESIVFTGESNQDIWVYKLSRDNGDSVWAQTYDNDGGEDIGYDVAVAPNGVVFVGATSLTVTDPKLHVCGFSDLGELLWTDPLFLNGVNGSPSLYCRHSDSCYLTGWYMLGNNTHPIVYLFKEDGAYSLLWDEGGTSAYAITGLDVNNDGYLYLSSSRNSGIRLNKRNAEGGLIWNQSFEEDGVNLKGWQCRVGPTQEVFFCGERFTQDADFLLLKWSASGVLLWDQGKHYDLGHDEYCRDMWVDAISDCYLAGWQVRGTEEDAALVKTDSAGNMLWSWVYEMEGDQQIEGIEVDEEGYIYLAGSHHNGSNWDMLVMQVRQPLMITGRITDSVGSSMEGITVSLSGDTTVEVYTDTGGYYGIEVYNGGDYTVSPDLPGWAFTPPSHTYSPLAHRELDQNFSGEWTGIEEEDVTSSVRLEVSASEIRFSLPQSSLVRLAIYDPVGREVAVLADGRYPSGNHQVIIPEIQSGVYFIRMATSGFEANRKVILLR